MSGLNQASSWVYVGGAVLIVVVVLMVAAYAADRGHPFFPVLVAILLIGPFGPGLALLWISLTPRRN